MAQHANVFRHDQFSLCWYVLMHYFNPWRVYQAAESECDGREEFRLSSVGFRDMQN